jgi:hypothetical protein
VHKGDLPLGRRRCAISRYALVLRYVACASESGGLLHSNALMVIGASSIGLKVHGVDSKDIKIFRLSAVESQKSSNYYGQPSSKCQDGFILVFAFNA